MIDKAVRDFPHPLSPTRPKTSASSISKLRLLTTFIKPLGDLKKILRFLTLRRDTAGYIPPFKKPRVSLFLQCQGLLFFADISDIVYYNCSCTMEDFVSTPLRRKFPIVLLSPVFPYFGKGRNYKRDCFVKTI